MVIPAHCKTRLSQRDRARTGPTRWRPDPPRDASGLEAAHQPDWDSNMKLSSVMTRTIVALSLAALAASCAGTSSSPPLPPEPPPGFRVIEQGQRSDEANGISTAYQVLASSTKASDGLHYNLKSLAADGWTTQETPRGDICLSRSRDDGSVEMLDAWRYDGQKGSPSHRCT